jgi:hypothetical protein
MRPGDKLIWSLATAVTLMWLASGFDVLLTQKPASLEVFIATTTLEGVIVGYAVKWRGMFRVEEEN